MASSKSRQRELARAKYHRQMARKAASERRRRQVWASVATGLALLLVVGFVTWKAGVFGGKKDEQPTAGGSCFWTPKDPSGQNIKDVGVPPTSGIPNAGTRKLNITFASGLVETELDLAKAPCTAASFAHLASHNFFDNTKCHRLLNEGDSVLQCGDPSGTGTGGPAYSFGDENLPSAPPPSPDPSASAGATPSPTAATTVVYPKGTLAMANSGPNTNSSQFFIVFKDSPFPPNYTIFGTVTSGLDVIEKIAAAGTVDNGQGERSKPTNDVIIQSLTIGEVETTPTPGAPTSGTPSGAPSGTPAPSATSGAPTS